MNPRHAAAVLASLAAAAVPAPASAHQTHRVQPGETLWSIAAAAGTTPQALAAENSLPAESGLLAGQVIEIPVAADPPAAAWAGLDSDAAPLATQERVTPGLVQQLALEHGVSPSLAAAIAHQESGFSNAFVSTAGARGVMQLLPATWDFVASSLTTHPLQPASAQDNVHAGVTYLAWLARDSGGDEPRAVAAYYQGLASVRAVGVLRETQAYVANVMALRGSYGGP